MVLFWADWAPQCQQMIDVLQELSKNPSLTSVAFCKVRIKRLLKRTKKLEACIECIYSGFSRKKPPSALWECNLTFSDVGHKIKIQQHTKMLCVTK